MFTKKKKQIKCLTKEMISDKRLQNTHVEYELKKVNQINK